MRRNLKRFGLSNVKYVSPSPGDFPTIQAAVNAAVSGDTVFISPGTYNEQITLKNGVNFHFMPGVTVASSNSTGTIIDNNTAVLSDWQGSPLITNTNGLDKRIVLQNSASKITGFTWDYIAILSQSGSNPPTVQKLLKNTLGGTPAFSYEGPGIYTMTLNGAFNDDKIIGSFTNSGNLTRLIFQFESGNLNEVYISTDNEMDGRFSYARMELHIFP